MTSEVFSLRIPKKTRREMEKVPIDWSEEIRRFIEKRLREYYKKELLKEARELRKKMKKISSAELIREDRER
ncbi:MAG: VapB-type antitoxin [Candidatus Asgardarchaeum sp.]|nr:VapB-type antitoxin [Candidatus Odinarchaeota archaeon]